MKRSAVTFFAAVALFGATEGRAASIGLPTTPDYHTAVSPIFGYDPVYGIVLGGAWFRYPATETLDQPRYREVFAQGTFGGQFRVDVRQRRVDVWPGWDHQLAVSVDNFFDYEFPEGETDYDRFDRWRLDVNNELDRSLTDQVSVFGRVFIGGQFHERDGDTGFAYPGLGLRWDSRNTNLNPRRGSYAITSVDVQPDVLHSSDLGRTGWQAGLDLRHYWPVFEQSVLALRADGQLADGKVFETTLGGDRQLRGYVARRFTGDTRLATQAELRFPIVGWVSGVTFVETGWIAANDEWEQPSSLGGGLRFGLPPDGQMKVRADMGVSDEGEVQFFVSFNQVF